MQLSFGTCDQRSQSEENTSNSLLVVSCYSQGSMDQTQSVENQNRKNEKSRTGPIPGGPWFHGGGNGNNCIFRYCHKIFWIQYFSKMIILVMKPDFINQASFNHRLERDQKVILAVNHPSHEFVANPLACFYSTD